MHSTSKHTPDPWTVNKTGIDSPTGLVAQWFTPPDYADGRLIAAAPELLAALTEVLEWTTDDRTLTLDTGIKRDDWQDVLAARVGMLRAVIAKAEGR